MRTQLIQKKAQIGSQISCTLTTGGQVSGLLTEIGLDHITLNGAKGETTILVEAIIAVQSLDDQGNESVSSEPTPSQIEPPNSPISASNRAGTTKSTTISPDSTEASDSSSISPAQIDGEDSSGSMASVNLKEPASEKLDEIENRFSTEIQSAKLELKLPDLTFPAKELTDWQGTDAVAKWLHMKRWYKDVQEYGALSAKVDGFQPVTADIKSLVVSFPESAALKKVLAYFSSISDNWDEALQNYQQAAVQSKKDDDWFEVAVSALRLNKEELACYSLEKFFYGVSIIAEPQAWRVYANLLEKFRNLPAFRELCKTDKYARETEEIEVLLETAIYLLKRMGAAKVATDIIRKWTAGTSPKSLLSQACENLDGRPAKPYRQFLGDFMNAMLVSEKKTVPRTTDRLESLSAAKPPVHRQTPQQVAPGFSGELSKFARFFLERCTFEGILADRVSEGKYTGSERDVGYDIWGLEYIAKQLGTKRPRDRSNCYLSAARIYVDVGYYPNSFYRYLCRSFASRGDAAVSENRNLDTVREWYCEALTVYDKDRGRHKGEEQDAVNSLVRYLYSTLGHAHIVLTPQIPPISEAVKATVSNPPDKEKAFEAIAYLVLHSEYAAEKVLSCLYHDETLRRMALDYLGGMKITVPEVVESFNDFGRLWKELRREKLNRVQTLSNELHLLGNFNLTTAWLEDNIRLTEEIRSKLFFELDLQRVGEVHRILEIALELCKQVTFEERERLCIQLLNHCEDRLGEIEDNPTRLSVEDVYPILKVIHEKLNAYLENLYETSKPNLTIRLPVESYFPDTNRKIEVQIVVENEGGRSPAESLELDILEDSAFFEVAKSNMGQAESLRGGDQSILEVPLQLTREASRAQTFSLPVHARYRTRAKEEEKTPVENLSIRLYSADEFEEIENPYAAYAEGGVVGDSKMFFGREELIQNIAHAIQESRLDSKCIVVFGQKRSGKSSVLHHLKASLQKDSELLILDLGNLGSIQEEDSSAPLLHQILKRILTVLEYAIEDRVDAGFTSFALPIPDDSEFYGHPAPLQCFQDTFERLKRQVARHEDWRGVRAVLLIDEFQYIYARIVAGKIPESFMQNWKALLQANYFSAVLVGQDVMPKFKERFPNEFGTTQDERVTYLTQGDARRLVDEPIRIGGPQGESRYREQAIERILELTAGSPFYIQIVCNRLVEYMNSKHAALVTAADVEHVKNELIAGVNALGLDKFDNLINSGDTSADAISDEDARKVLKVIADNSRTGLCHRDTIVCETHLPLDTILNDMVKRDVVERREESYRIQVGLFKEWLIVNG